MKHFLFFSIFSIDPQLVCKLVDQDVIVSKHKKIKWGVGGHYFKNAPNHKMFKQGQLFQVCVILKDENAVKIK